MAGMTVEKVGEERPVPDEWRSVLVSVVDAIAAGVAPSFAGVEPSSPTTWSDIQDYIEDYGETLAPLPAESWNSSVYIWYGTYWNVLVDLFTEEEGLSDMVMQVRVHESAEGYRFEVDMVYVP